tara:strand:+ start:3599 stop:3733 length:135 start_codon:yes stop_codon:yes gene_type:complete
MMFKKPSKKVIVIYLSILLVVIVIGISFFIYDVEKLVSSLLNNE